MIGVGIITCNRPEFFKKCRESIKEEWYDHIVVVNDGKGPLFNANSPILALVVQKIWLLNTYWKRIVIISSW